MDIRVLDISGSPFDMGVAHGRAHGDAIRRFAEERVRLASEGPWTGGEFDRDGVLDLAELCVEAHRAYAPELHEELEGLAEATGLSPAELVIVGGFTDFVDTVYAARRDPVPIAAPLAADNCTAFLVPNGRSRGGQGFCGQTWDMHHSATEHVVLLRGRPADGPAFLAFTTVGCVGMIGMNEAGIAVGINNLIGSDGQPGVTWPFVIRRVLQQETLEAALACLEEAPLAGAHNYLLMDAAGRGVNVEATPSLRHLSELDGEPLVHTNHCLVPATQQLERPRDPDSSSEERLDRGRELLQGSDITVEDLQELTRDPVAICYTARPPRWVETCGAAIMRPASREFWAVWGLPSENRYQRFSLRA